MALITDKPIQTSLGPTASGGNSSPTITLDGISYQLHIFTGNGNWTVSAAGYADIFLVAGGGGTASRSPGGAGAGGVVWHRHRYCTAQTYSFEIGGGGSPGAGGGNNAGTRGADSVFKIQSSTTLLTAKGGGEGCHPSTAGKDGGSGGGHSWDASQVGSATQMSQSGDSGIYGHGNNSGIPSDDDRGSAGGGGAGVPGGDGTDSILAGEGGNGIDMSSILGTGYGEQGWFAGGGGGGTGNDGGTAHHGGAGGKGGGGNGRGSPEGVYNLRGEAGAGNTGGGSGGGAGGGGGNTHISGNSGGSGIAIVRYQLQHV